MQRRGTTGALCLLQGRQARGCELYCVRRWCVDQHLRRMLSHPQQTRGRRVNPSWPRPRDPARASHGRDRLQSCCDHEHATHGDASNRVPTYVTSRRYVMLRVYLHAVVHSTQSAPISHQPSGTVDPLMTVAMGPSMTHQHGPCLHTSPAMPFDTAGHERWVLLSSGVAGASAGAGGANARKPLMCAHAARLEGPRTPSG